MLLFIALMKTHLDLGPAETHNLPKNSNELSKEDQTKTKRELKQKKDFIVKGKSRIMEKAKEVWKAFSRAVVSGFRSGSNKLVFEHYDKLIFICGGRANTKPLSFGVSRGDFWDEDFSTPELWEDNKDDLVSHNGDIDSDWTQIQKTVYKNLANLAKLECNQWYQD